MGFSLFFQNGKEKKIREAPSPLNSTEFPRNSLEFPCVRPNSTESPEIFGKSGEERISRSETWVPKRGGLKPAGKRQEGATFLQRSFFDVAVQFFVCCSAAFGPNDFRTAEKPMLQCSFCSAAFRKLQRNFRFRLWHVAGAGFRGVGFIRVCQTTPQTALSSNRLFLGQKNLEWCYKKRASGRNLLAFEGWFLSTSIFASSTSIVSTELVLGWCWSCFFFFFLLWSWWTSRSSVVVNLRICWNCSWWLCALPLSRASLWLSRCAWLPRGWIHRSSADFRGGFFCFSRPSKTAQKERFGSDTFWGLIFFGCSTQCRPYFCSVCELEIRYVLGPRDFLCFLGPSFLFFGGVKNLILGGGEKNVARVVRGLWLGTMMMGARWDILTFQCRHTWKRLPVGSENQTTPPWTLTKCTQKHVHTTGSVWANEPGKHTNAGTSRGEIEFKGGTWQKPCTFKKIWLDKKRVDRDSLVHNTFWGVVWQSPRFRTCWEEFMQSATTASSASLTIGCTQRGSHSAKGRVSAF